MGSISKGFSSILIFVLAVLSLTLISSIHLGLCQNGTNVSYIIGSDTTWTQANSPYNFTGNVLVNNGVTLTIGTGVTVDLNNYYMRVNGTLIIQPGVTINMGLIGDGIDVYGILSAIGTSVNPIHINGSVQSHIIIAFYSAITFYASSTGWNQQTNSGSIFENAVFSDILLEVSSGVKISDCELLSGVLMPSGGSPTISNDNIASQVDIIGGSPVISDNKITGGLSINAGSGVVSNNDISGLTLDDTFGTPLSTSIERNLISDSSVGITCMIHGSGNNEANIEDNTVTNNSVGVQIQSQYLPAIVDNNIYGNSWNAKLSGVSTEINLPNNWWGTTDQQAINQTIYDFKDDFTLGTINFVPFLTSPNPQALPSSNVSLPTFNPTASPIPSASSHVSNTSTSSPTSTPNATLTSRGTTATPTSVPLTTFTTVVAVLLAVIIALLLYIRKRNRPVSVVKRERALKFSCREHYKAM